jgi:Cys-tRNA(Pro)/Cys-tRNA(Cys) deacylase
MADTKTAERITGYLVGGISPFATKQNLSVIMDESIPGNDKVLVNAGQRGIMILITPSAIQNALGCKVADLTHP